MNTLFKCIVVTLTIGFSLQASAMKVGDKIRFTVFAWGQTRTISKEVISFDSKKNKFKILEMDGLNKSTETISLADAEKQEREHQDIMKNCEIFGLKKDQIKVGDEVLDACVASQVWSFWYADVPFGLGRTVKATFDIYGFHVYDVRNVLDYEWGK